ncbi:MAG: 4Fe-4S dicluster domain-containing protein [Pirellulaceae bacterium]
MPNFGFLIDNRKCIGCHACTVACKSEHEVPIGVDRTWVKYIEKGVFPNNRRLFTVMRCNHCDAAPCVSICPVTSLYRRDDGVVDFNSDRCIGCKACMQACPYDALHIDPETDTVAKCNFCTHRLEAGLEPSCVVVCPEQAIVGGDLDNSRSEISRLIERHPVQVRKPEKGTRPKLVYIDADVASLVPARTEAGGRSLWSRGEFVACDGRIAPPTIATAAGNGSSTQFQESARPAVEHRSSPRRVYDVRPRAPAWGWAVAAYTWTKSISAGAFLAAVAARLLPGPAEAAVMPTILGIAALLFLLVTTALLVADLKQPKRFLYVLLRPRWGSWLVRGAYFLVGYGAVLSAWLIARLSNMDALADVLMWPGALLAGLSAVYTAFLFAQAMGRDFWQNPLLSVHLLAHASLAGGAVWLLCDAFAGGGSSAVPRFFTMATLSFSLVTLSAEICTTPPTDDARRAMEMIIGRPMGGWFWGAGIAIGHVLPLILLATGVVPAVVAPLLVLGGMFVIERLWVLAPQRVPLS